MPASRPSAAAAAGDHGGEGERERDLGDDVGGGAGGEGGAGVAAELGADGEDDDRQGDRASRPSRRRRRGRSGARRRRRRASGWVRRGAGRRPCPFTLGDRSRQFQRWFRTRKRARIRTMELRRLRLLHEFSRRGTVAAVAEALSYSPSSVSVQLAELEREAGVPLLRRAGRTLELTPAGTRLADHAAQALTADEAVRAELAALSGTPRGRRADDVRADARAGAAEQRAAGAGRDRARPARRGQALARPRPRSPTCARARSTSSSASTTTRSPSPATATSTART